MNIKKTIVASLLACMLPAVVMAKDVSIGVSMALFDDNFLTILRTSMQKEMKKDYIIPTIFLIKYEEDRIQPIQIISEIVEKLELCKSNTEKIKAELILSCIKNKPESFLPLFYCQ